MFHPISLVASYLFPSKKDMTEFRLPDLGRCMLRWSVFGCRREREKIAETGAIVCGESYLNVVWIRMFTSAVCMF